MPDTHPVPLPRSAEDPAYCSVTARRLIRAGAHRGQTGGLAMGRLQSNVAILPQDYALDFAIFCHRNPKPCPLVAVAGPGDPMLPQLGDDIDIRTDVPSYNVYRDGELADQVTDLGTLWRDDLVTFALGCSFSFEEALLEAGIPLRHLEQGTTVPMYRTTIMTNPSGPFRGPMVVSMRPMSPEHAIRAIEITSCYPAAHGAPLHIGAPARIGIAALDRPDWGDPLEIRDGEVPVFWACGVTPQLIVREAKPALCITHTPGCMLISDRASREVNLNWSG